MQSKTTEVKMLKAVLMGWINYKFQKPSMYCQLRGKIIRFIKGGGKKSKK